MPKTVSFKRMWEAYKSLVDYFPEHRDTLKLFVKALIATYQREDRVIYVINLHRYSLLQNESDLPRNLLKLKKKLKYDYELNAYFNFKFIRDTLNHYITTATQNNYAEVLDHQWSAQDPNELISQLDLLERTAIEKIRGKSLPLQEGRILLQFDDGYYWTLLPTSSCELEGAAMGHCGNLDAEFQRIISLRSTDRRGNPQAHLTFIWHQIKYGGEMSVDWPAAPGVVKGYLGETKGFGNSKPAKKYHKHIIELLKIPMIQLVVGGGYKHENNFSLQDLTGKQQKDLYSLKPELFSLADFYETYGQANTLTLIATLFEIDQESDIPSLPIVGDQAVIATHARRHRHSIESNAHRFWDELDRLQDWSAEQSQCDESGLEISKSIHKGDIPPHLPALSEVPLEEFFEYTVRVYPRIASFLKEIFATEEPALIAEKVRTRPGIVATDVTFGAMIYAALDVAAVAHIISTNLHQTNSAGSQIVVNDDQIQVLYPIENLLETLNARLNDFEDIKQHLSGLPEIIIPETPLPFPSIPQLSLDCFSRIMRSEYQTYSFGGDADQEYQDYLEDEEAYILEGYEDYEDDEDDYGYDDEDDDYI